MPIGITTESDGYDTFAGIERPFNGATESVTPAFLAELSLEDDTPQSPVNITLAEALDAVREHMLRRETATLVTDLVDSRNELLEKHVFEKHPISKARVVDIGPVMDDGGMFYVYMCLGPDAQPCSTAYTMLDDVIDTYAPGVRSRYGFYKVYLHPGSKPIFLGGNDIWQLQTSADEGADKINTGFKASSSFQNRAWRVGFMLGTIIRAAKSKLRR